MKGGSPQHAGGLRALWGGFQSARVLLTANNFRVFDHLKSPATADAVAVILKTDRRATGILLDALTGLGLLKKTAGTYRNTSMANRCLAEGGPLYQGDILRHADVLWKNWSGLDEVVKTGQPYRAAHDQDSFIKGMHNIASLKAEKVIRAVDMKGVKGALDLGGGPGTYSLAMAKTGASVTLFDTPDTIKIARQMIRGSQLRSIRFVEGDFLSNDIGGGYDLIFISQVLHSCSPEECLLVIRKSRNALNPGGRVAIQEFSISSDGTRPAQNALFSINMLVNTRAGRCYSRQEIKRWLLDAGLRQIKHTILDDTVLVTAKNARS